MVFAGLVEGLAICVDSAASRENSSKHGNVDCIHRGKSNLALRGIEADSRLPKDSLSLPKASQVLKV